MRFYKLFFLFFSVLSVQAKLVEQRVCLENQYSSFGIYDQSPESPDGTRIVYVVYDYFPDEQKMVAPVSLWICDRDLKNHRSIKKLEDLTCNHNGAFQQWIDNNSIAYSGTHIKKVNDKYLKGSIRVINADTGKLEFGPFTGGFLSDNSFNGKVMMNMQFQDNNLGSQGLYELDTKKGIVKCLFRNTDFEQYRDKYNWPGNKDPKLWSTTHSMNSTDGSHIAFSIHTHGKDGHQQLFTCKADKTDLVYWGADFPGHFLWYDKNTLWGADNNVDDGHDNDRFFKRWDRHRNYIETLSGPGCHTAASADRLWFAGETGYYSNPVKLFLYRKGMPTPAAVIFEHKFPCITWKARGHANPSFSRDGKRIYYNRAVSETIKQAYFCDISKIIEGQH